jgi:hypothetical protein
MSQIGGALPADLAELGKATLATDATTAPPERRRETEMAVPARACGFSRRMKDMEGA